MAKIEPAVMKIYFSIPNVVEGSDEDLYIDISQVASIVNRRFYRQGLNWAVQGFEVFTNPNVSGSIGIFKVPNTWMAFNAWQKAFSHWLEQQNETIDEAGIQSTVARYRDYKIFADREHVSAGFAANWIPVDADLTPFATGEWEHSQVVLPNYGASGNTEERGMHFVGGDHAGSFGLISNYSLSRSYPHSPDPAIPAAVDSMFNQMQNVGFDDDEIIDNVTNKNNDLPYDQDNYPGGGVNAPTLQKVDSWESPASSITNEQHLDGGNFPCGLIKVVSSLNDPVPSSLTSGLLCLKLVPGMARGYLNEPMQDV